MKIRMKIEVDLLTSISITRVPYHPSVDFIYQEKYVLIDYGKFIPRITPTKYLKFFRKAMRFEFETDKMRRDLHKQYLEPNEN